MFALIGVHSALPSHRTKPHEVGFTEKAYSNQVGSSTLCLTLSSCGFASQGAWEPNALLTPAAAAVRRPVAAHLFAFGGFERTAAWAAARAGRGPGRDGV